MLLGFVGPGWVLVVSLFSFFFLGGGGEELLSDLASWFCWSRLGSCCFVVFLLFCCWGGSCDPTVLLGFVGPGWVLVVSLFSFFFLGGGGRSCYPTLLLGFVGPGWVLVVSWFSFFFVAGGEAVIRPCFLVLLVQVGFLLFRGFPSFLLLGGKL